MHICAYTRTETDTQPWIWGFSTDVYYVRHIKTHITCIWALLFTRYVHINRNSCLDRFYSAFQVNFELFQLQFLIFRANYWYLFICHTTTHPVEFLPSSTYAPSAYMGTVCPDSTQALHSSTTWHHRWCSTHYDCKHSPHTVTADTTSTFSPHNPVLMECPSCRATYHLWKQAIVAYHICAQCAITVESSSSLAHSTNVLVKAICDC